MDVKEAIQKAKQIHEVVTQEYDRQYKMKNEEREKALRDIEKDYEICELKAKLNSLKEEKEKLNKEYNRGNMSDDYYQTRKKIDRYDSMSIILNDEIYDRKKFLIQEYDKKNLFPY
jgi:hypothetical protein